MLPDDLEAKRQAAQALMAQERARRAAEGSCVLCGAFLNDGVCGNVWTPYVNSTRKTPPYGRHFVAKETDR